MLISLSLQLTPLRTKGKGTNDPLKNLPQLPLERSKPVWQQNPPTFKLTAQSETEGEDKHGIDLIAELTASEYKKKSDMHVHHLTV